MAAQIQIAVALDEHLRTRFFNPEQWERLTALGDVCRISDDATVLVTGWDTPRLDRAFLSAAPRLRLVAHTGAAVRFLVSDELFARGIRVTQAGAAMAPAAGSWRCTPRRSRRPGT